MADRNSPEYVPGRGLPPYLLSRTYDGSSTDSDGASRIFMDTDPSRTTGEYTGSSATSIMTYSSSSFSISSISSISNANSNSERNAFQHEPSSIVSSIYDDSSETRTIRSKAQSNFGETYSIVSNREPVREVSIPSSISYMDTLYTGPIGHKRLDMYQLQCTWVLVLKVLPRVGIGGIGVDGYCAFYN